MHVELTANRQSKSFLFLLSFSTFQVGLFIASLLPNYSLLYLVMMSNDSKVSCLYLMVVFSSVISAYLRFRICT